jgi:hypothetical protein
MKIDLIVTRHAALLSYLQEIGLTHPDTRCLPHVCERDVQDKHVAGVLPHHLSSLTRLFTEIPLQVPTHLRRQELTLEQIRRFAGRPLTYEVRRIKHA